MKPTDDHLRAIAYLAADMRPAGAPRWDREGIYACIARLRDRGYGLPEIANRTIKHAQDPTAKTPGVVNTAPLYEPAAETRTPFPPKREEQCFTCSRVGCDCPPEDKKPRETLDISAETRAMLDAAKADMREKRYARKAAQVSETKGETNGA